MYDADILSTELPVEIKPKKKLRILPVKNTSISLEDYDIVATLNGLGSEIKNLHNCLDNVTDPALIDSYIYEIQAANMKYKYYLDRCKEKGIIANGL